MANKEQLKELREGVEAWNARTRGYAVKIDLLGANLRRANLTGAYLVGANLTGANLRHADLDYADLTRANLSKADLLGANLRRANLSRANLREANLRGANLIEAYLDDANLSSANLIEAKLSRADFSRATLHDAKLSEASLRSADFSSADLRGADFREASLVATHFSRAELGDANLAKSHLVHTNFGDVDLSGARGLEEVRHGGASTIGTDTLFQSKGKIPEVFLRGCGLTDWEIASAKLHDPDLASKEVTDLAYEIVRIKAESPIQINPIFLSYSRKDSEFVDTIEERFDENRIRYWRDTRHATSGPLEEIVDQAMHHGRIVLLILSKDSVNSDWVEWEVKKARELQQECGDHVLCPIAIDRAWETCKWPGRLRAQVEKYNILDFSEWQDEAALATAFQRLIEGLGIYYPKDVAG